jgi:hypothetical protein
MALAGLLVAPEFAFAKPGVAIQTQSGDAMRLLGYIAFGTADDIAALEANLGPLSSLGVKAARPKTPDGRIELMILFTEGTGPITAALVRQKITDGKLGHFEFESILAPESAVK